MQCNSRLQTYRILHDNLSKKWNTFFLLTLKQASWGKNVQTGRKLQPEIYEKQENRSKSGEIGRKLQPEIYERQGNRSKSGEIGGRCSNQELRGSKRVGAKMLKQEEMLQSEMYEKQENWSNSGETGGRLQPERVENQADWG